MPCKQGIRRSIEENKQRRTEASANPAQTASEVSNIISSSLDSIIEVINSIETLEDENLSILDELVQKIFDYPCPERATEALFQVYERFPDSNDHGVFWGLLHGLEALPGYEYRLVESVRKLPMNFNLAMVNRLLNAGVTKVGDTDLIALFEEVEGNPAASDSAKEEARGFLEYQQAKKKA